MKIRAIALGILFCILAAVVSVAAAGEPAGPNTAELHGKRIGVLEGSTNGEAIRSKIPEFTLLYFMTSTDLLTALKSGGLDAVIADLPVIAGWAARDGSFRMLPGVLQEGNYAIAMRKDANQLAERVNAILREFRADGTLERLHNKWVAGPAEGKVLPDIPNEGEGVLRFAVAEVGAPFMYLNAEEKAVGYDIELGMLIANKLGAKLEIKEMLFAHLLQAVVNGSADMAASALSVTPDRQEEVLFSLPYYRGGSGVLVRK